MKQGVSPDMQQKVLDLRRHHSLRQFAEMAGISLGTIKAICGRLGAYKDNEQQSIILSLPPGSGRSATAASGQEQSIEHKCRMVCFELNQETVFDLGVSCRGHKG